MSFVREAVWTALLLSCISLQTCIGDYQLEVHLVSYENPTHRLYSGECCNGGWPSCGREPCNNVFTFCMRPFNSGFVTTRNLTGCFNNRVITTAEHTVGDSYTFADNSRAVPSILVFSGVIWPGTFQLYVGIDDKDYFSDGLQFVDSIFINYELPADGHLTEEIVWMGMRHTQLKLQFRASCTSNFSGDSCLIFCGIDGCSPERAVCVQEGECTCIDGHAGPTCAIDLPSSITSTATPTTSSGSTAVGVRGAIKRSTIIGIAIGSAFAGVFLLIIVVVSIIVGVICCCTLLKRSRRNYGSYTNLTAGNEHWTPGDNPTYTGVVGGYHVSSASSSLQHQFDNALYGSTSPPHIYETVDPTRGRIARLSASGSHSYSPLSSQPPPPNDQLEKDTEDARYSVITRENLADSGSASEEEEGGLSGEEQNGVEAVYSVITQENLGSNASLVGSASPSGSSSASHSDEEGWQHKYTNPLYQHMN